MTTLNTGDVMRVALTGHGPQTTVWQNVWHYRMISGAGTLHSDFTASLAAHYVALWTAIRASIHTSYGADQFEVWRRDPALEVWNGIDTAASLGHVGLSATDPSAHGVAFVARYITDLLRRQGRQFIPGFADSTVDLGLFDAGAAAAMVVYMTLFPNDLAPVGGVFRLCTYNTDPLSPYYQTASEATGSYVLNLIPGYQRRRKPLVGI